MGISVVCSVVINGPFVVVCLRCHYLGLISVVQ